MKNRGNCKRIVDGVYSGQSQADYASNYYILYILHMSSAFAKLIMCI